MSVKSHLSYQLKNLEKLPVKVWRDSHSASVHVARSIALAIQAKQQEGEQIVLGLATGSSPIGVYKELVRIHKEEGLSFSNVVTFNLDEYYPMDPTSQQSYVKFMHEYLFDHIDIPAENINIPDGTLDIDQVAAYCEAYEKKIDLLGGIDIQLLGIGRTGHIGFNEPGSWRDSHTRLVRLDDLTRRDAAKDFGGADLVPYRAVTMGINSIMKAQSIYLLAWGQHKAAILQKAVEGPITSAIPSTYLQEHPNTRVIVDEAASTELTRVKTPWLVGICNWDESLMTKAVIWLSQTVDKPILKLTDTDYNENHLSDLTIEYASSYELNIKVHNHLQDTITGWPGGKPNVDDSRRPERANPGKKRVILFSPHPDDDVISMGGTFLRLVEQGHEVHVAYQTSGNIAVHDYDALRYIEMMQEFGRNGVMLKDEYNIVLEEALSSLKKKNDSETDSAEVRRIKGLIRRGEARAGARYVGLEDHQIHFLDLPFYETGSTRKNPIGQADIDIIKKLMQDIKPHQVFAAGDLADPHGTHRVCLDAIFESFEQLKEENWIKDCWLWLYRGAWHEYAIHEIEMAVPISPVELKKKRRAIFMHQSQKDTPPFPGQDEREFWQRAEDRNRATAKAYRGLGLSEYEAMEAFRRWRFDWDS
ncbi:MAG: glucosamine-6-phosphate deaminase [Bacteroidota bacterium]